MISLPWFSEQHENEANFLFSFVRKHSKKTKNDRSPCHLQGHAQVVRTHRKKERKKRKKQKRKKETSRGFKGGGSPPLLWTKYFTTSNRKIDSKKQTSRELGFLWCFLNILKTFQLRVPPTQIEANLSNPTGFTSSSISQEVA